MNRRVANLLGPTWAIRGCFGRLTVPPRWAENLPGNSVLIARGPGNTPPPRGVIDMQEDARALGVFLRYCLERRRKIGVGDAKDSSLIRDFFVCSMWRKDAPLGLIFDPPLCTFVPRMSYSR